mmetsp:Transcript_11926/g.14421  ORF Transcript_11926/g.14421 Transcript_11926/m.14421 type:complete len:160 (+) Transcript_11926:94-573(+)|eukprot:CAMPEP_0114333602 /NCGR_PEP_ID=MMETSP0101-20121206/3859_1 /TAXON_ID=38822 ORGANISM="Pteridomonas danica, Strain PT" /NCGR_SAMPLE_ID=MMETSP0101 /ASSEMBLY_ACC=CAM_ASM_000211 /LENGTH=159 /DNA_ID=CAMNT_0001464665 /DNA_START=62 /DNA_END=541 /DNA_ORIENTATION=-
MPTISDFSTVEFPPVLAMKLERPSMIVSGQIATMSKGKFQQIPQFKFYIDENTDIDDVMFVLCNKIGCSINDVGFITAGLSMKHRDGAEKLSDIFGPKAREGDANRFMRREIMQCSIWPAGYEERQAARFAKMFDGPKNFKPKGLEEKGAEEIESKEKD